MGTINVKGSGLGTALQELLDCDDIQPGSSPSYAVCKVIYTYHPLGAKLAELPIKMAQSQQREISIPNSPEERVRDRFVATWKELEADKYILNTATLARVYGIASVALMAEGVPSDRPVKYKELPNLKISFNVFDPLNTAGSLVLSQDPNSQAFQSTAKGVSVNGQVYHPSRACIMMNEQPIYIDYTASAYGFTGRSVYQRVLFPLKSFIQSMRTDDMVTRKAGVIVATLKAAGSIVDNIMAAMTGVKRNIIKEAQTDNVISITEGEEISTLDMKNLAEAYKLARENILENIASGADDMPAKLLNAETFAEGFGEGTEDAKHVAQYIDRIREQMSQLYAFFTKICQYRAWTPEFYATIQADFPEYKSKTFTQAFYEWTNDFVAAWPSLLTEPDSEKVKVDDVKLKACIALVEVLLPALDPANKAAIIEWAADNFNELKLLFQTPLVLDFEALATFNEEQAVNQQAMMDAGLASGEPGEDGPKEPAEPKPFAATDARVGYSAALERLVTSRDTAHKKRIA